MQILDENQNILLHEGKRFTNDKSTQRYYGHGKLLLSGEYFVLDGAVSLALPTKVGQSMSVKYSPSFAPVLHWKSFDVAGNLWFEAKYEFWHFDCLTPYPTADALMLQKILKYARRQNSHFLREDMDVLVETYLGFPIEWGLGSSSTLINNIASWANVSPFELLFSTFGGSGYDIACTQSDGPIRYQLDSAGPNWSPVVFNPSFKDDLFFVYLGKKQDSRKAIEYYRKKVDKKPETVAALSNLTEELLTVKSLEGFNFCILSHEELVARELNLKPAKEIHFNDFWGEVKSLGAWGGDFVLVTSNHGDKKTREYFINKGFPVIFKYKDLILSTAEEIKSENDEFLQ